MRDAEAPGKEQGKEGKGQEGGAGKQGEEAAAPPPPPKPLAVLRANAALIEKAVAQKETRTLFGRVLRQTAGVRRRLTAADLSAFLEGALPPGSPALQQLVAAVKQVLRVLGTGAGGKRAGSMHGDGVEGACAEPHALPPFFMQHCPAAAALLPLLLQPAAAGCCRCLPAQAGEAAMEDGDAANGSAAEEEAASQPPAPPSGLPEVEM